MISAVMLVKIKRTVRKILAGTMAVWLSGIVFLACCQQLNARSMEMESCPLAKMSEHCDKATRQDADRAFVELTEQPSVDCCGFLPVVFDKSRKIEQAEKQVAITSSVVALKFSLPPILKITPSFSAFRSRTPDRHGIFVENCVFRI